MPTHPHPHPRGFTLIETAASITIITLLLAVLLPMAHRIRVADGLQNSIANVSRIIQATQLYHFDHAGQAPMRGCRYVNGQLGGGWDTWSIGGKNCSTFWQSQIWDESAYGRFLNPYITGTRIERPADYVSTGSGSTWNFNDGTPTAQQRANFQLPVFRSPGDVASRQRNWPLPDPTISAYNDIGTSYVTNMMWWDLPSLPSGFSPRFAEGSRRIGLAFSGANPNYVFIADQTAEAVVNFSASTQTQGEFGKINASVVGFADGRAAYIRILPGSGGFTLSGPGYTLIP